MIGGFLPLEPGGPPVARGVPDLWGVGDDTAWLFANARSALAYLLRWRGVERLWLPAYICPELADAGAGIAIAWYPLSADLSPDVARLRVDLRAGDCVLAVDFFGRAPAGDFRDLAASRADILWVEDRAQALWPAPEPWAKWVLYSPRKLFGVAEGGIMVHGGGRVARPDYAPPLLPDCAAPRRMPAGDAAARARRYAAYRRIEDAMAVSVAAMGAATRARLAAIDPAPAMQRRRANFDALAALLGDVALISGRIGDFVPFGFPVRLRDCARVAQALAELGIFAARHWPDLRCDPAAFPEAHALARAVLTLPCDQRYEVSDMRRVAAALREALR